MEIAYDRMNLNGERGMRTALEPFTKEAGFCSLSPVGVVRLSREDGGHHLERCPKRRHSTGPDSGHGGRSLWMASQDKPADGESLAREPNQGKPGHARPADRALFGGSVRGV